MLGIINKVRELVDSKGYAFGHTAIALAGLALFWRMAGVMPSFLADELVYKQQALNAGPYELSNFGNTGNHLYTWLFSFTSMCGPQFYACSKLLNVAIWTAAASVTFIFLNRRVGTGFSFLVAISIFLSPLSSYTSVFMPEVMFYSVALIWLLGMIAYLESPTTRNSLISGLIFGALWLVKPHALMAIPAIGVLFVYLAIRRGQSAKTFAQAAIFFMTALSTRLFVGFLAAGSKGLDLLADYGNAATTASTSEANFSNVFLDILGIQVFGHLASVLVSIGGFIAILLIMIGMGFKPTRQFKDFSVLLFLLIASLVAASIVFTALVTTIGDDHTYRILSRYYEWAYVGIFMLVAILFSSGPEGPRRRSFLILGALTALTACGLSWYQFAGYQLKGSDSLFASAYLQGFVSFYFWLIAPLLIVVALAVKRTQTVAVAAGLLSIVAMGWASNLQFIDFRSGSNSADAAGMYADDFIGAGVEDAKILVVGNSKFTAASAAFWIDSKNIELLPVKQYAAVSSDFVTEDFDWVLSIGEVSMVGIDRTVATRGVGFELARLGSESVHYFTRVSPNSPFVATMNPGIVSPWGVWIGNEELGLRPSPEHGPIYADQIIVRYRTLPGDSEQLIVGVNGQDYRTPIDRTEDGSVAVFTLDSPITISGLTFRVEGGRTVSSIEAKSQLLDPNRLGLISVEVLLAQ